MPCAGIKKAAVGGNATAQSALGMAYQEGLGVDRDYGEALKWDRLAARQGWQRPMQFGDAVPIRPWGAPFLRFGPAMVPQGGRRRQRRGHGQPSQDVFAGPGDARDYVLARRVVPQSRAERGRGRRSLI